MTTAAVLAGSAEAAAIFLPGGGPPRAGQRLRNPDLAVTLERIGALGRAGFYEGETAREMARFSREHGGFFTEREWFPDASPARFGIVVTSSSPATGATGLNVGSSVKATFSRPMQATSLAGSTFKLRDPAGNDVPATVPLALSLLGSAGIIAFLILGLTIAYKIVTQHGGSIEVSNRRGGGATLSVAQVPGIHQRPTSSGRAGSLRSRIIAMLPT